MALVLCRCSAAPKILAEIKTTIFHQVILFGQYSALGMKKKQNNRHILQNHKLLQKKQQNITSTRICLNAIFRIHVKQIHYITKRLDVRPKNKHTVQQKNSKHHEELSLKQETVLQNRSAGTPGDGAPEVRIGSCRGSFELSNPFEHGALGVSES